MGETLDALAAGEERARTRRKPTPVLHRSLALLRAEGYHVAIVERRLPFARITVDAFGMFDAIAVTAGFALATRPGVLGVQVTTADNLAARRTKLRASPVFAHWLAAGNRIEAHGWKRPTKKERRWTVTRERMELTP